MLPCWDILHHVFSISSDLFLEYSITALLVGCLVGYPAPRQGNIPWLVVNTRAGSHCGDLCSVLGDCVHCELYIVSHG